MAAVPVRGLPKVKRTTMQSVIGKITCMSSDNGDKISQWGGTECFLSNENGYGPVLVVRSSRHKRGQGSYFRLDKASKIITDFSEEGKVSLHVAHEKRNCVVMVQANKELDEFNFENLKRLCRTLGRKEDWKTEIESNANRPSSRKRMVREDGAAEAGQPLQMRRLDDGRGSVDRVAEQLDGDDRDDYEEMEDGHATARDVARASVAPESHHGLTTEQMNAVRLVEQNNNVFVTGAAGTGKTAWLHHLLAKNPTTDGSIVVTATTAVAARRIGGSTVHAFAGIGHGEGAFEDIIKRVERRPEVVRGWRRCRLWIIDEVSALSSSLFDLLDKIARHVRKQAHAPFGGIQVVAVGDFLQLPPVVRRDANLSHADLIDSVLCIGCNGWQQMQFKTVEFTTNFRQKDDSLLQDALQDLRYGRGDTTAVKAMVKACMNRQLDLPEGLLPTKIMALIRDVDAHNDKMLAAINTNEFQRFTAKDSYADAEYHPDLNADTPLPQSIVLKPGAQVVLVHHLPDTPYRNGDVGTVVSFRTVAGTESESVPVVRFQAAGGERGDSGDRVIDGTEDVEVPPVACSVVGRAGVIVASRTQVPLRLAWAITVHKCQGMTLPFVETGIDKSFFEYGQAYVALSRARSADHLRLTAFDPAAIKAPKKAVEYYETQAAFRERAKAIRAARQQNKQ